MVHKTHVKSQGVEDNDNNRLTLTPILHRMFDGRRNKSGYTRIPRIMIEPMDDPPAATDLSSTQRGQTLWQQTDEMVRDASGTPRYKVWMKVSSLEMIDHETIAHFMKPGTYFDQNKVENGNGIPLCYTFVHV